MTTGDSGVLAPQALLLPTVNSTVSGANYMIGISGSSLVFWNGSAWMLVTAS